MSIPESETTEQQKVTDYRLGLRAKGYSPVPVNGKSPVLPAWNTAALEANDQVIAAWAEDYDYAQSTGVVHDGQVMCLDVDCTDLALMRKIHPVVLKHLPGARVRVGKSPKAGYFFQASGDLLGACTSIPLRWQAPSGKEIWQVEARGVGGQTLVDGIHPDTGKPYLWPHGELPLVSALPCLAGVQQLEDLIEEIRYLIDKEQQPVWLKARTASIATGQSAGSSSLGVASTPEFVEALLAELPNNSLDWDSWFYDVLVPVKGALAAEPDEGFELFEAWSATCEVHDSVGCQRWWDSISPSGQKGIGSLIRTVRNLGSWTPELQAMQEVLLVANRPTPEQEFTVVDPVSLSSAVSVLPALAVLPVQPAVAAGGGLPGPRPRLYGNHVLRGAVTLLGGRGGVSKTNLALLEAVAMASGKKILFDTIWFPAGLAVVHFNRDEVQEELTRRMLGIMKHYGLAETDVSGVLAYGRDVIPGEFNLVRGDNNPEVCQKSLDWLCELLLAADAKVLQLDPLVSFCSGETNAHFVCLAKAWAQIHKRTGVAGFVIHHLRKGVPGEEAEASDDADSLRGGGALVDLARTARVLRHMSKGQGEALGVTDESLRRRLVAVNRGAKENYYLSAFDLEWYRLESVGLGNASAPWPEDEIGVPVEWKVSSLAALTWQEQQSILTAIRAGTGPTGGAKWSTHAQSGDRHIDHLAEQLGLESDAVNAQIKIWLREKILTNKATGVGEDRHKHKGLAVLKSPIPVEFS